MSWKEQFGIEAGLQGGSKIPEHIVSNKEGNQIAQRAKARKEVARINEIGKAFESGLYESVQKGTITSRQAEMLSRGANPRQVFNS